MIEELDDLDAEGIDLVDLMDELRQQFTQPHEQVILDWIQDGDLQDVVFYPQENPTILITWATADAQDRILFREIDIVVEDERRFRISGGAMYHHPSYHVGWLSHRVVTTEGIQEALTDFQDRVNGLQFEDLTDMDAYLTGFMKDLLDP